MPDLSTYFLSVSQIAKNGKKVVFNNNKCEIFDCSNKLVASATLIGDECTNLIFLNKQLTV